MIRRMLLIAALALAAGGAAAVAPAGAQTYGGCSATVSDTTPAAGQSITVNGTGADASAAVSASVGGASVGSGTADADGAFSFSAVVPSTASGATTLSVDCGSTVASVSLTVGGSGALPRTGSSNLVPLTFGALAALAVGGAAVVAARRRSNA